MADDHKTPIDRALELFLYAPLGLAITAHDELPKLVEKGRTRLTTQLTMARMIGQFAATQGQQEAQKAAGKLADQVGTLASRLGGFPGVPGPTGGAAAAARSAGDAVAAERAAVGEHAGAGSGGGSGPGGRGSATPAAAATNGSNGAAPRASRAAGGRGPAAARGPAGPAVGSLAIPGYDTLSASQVVQRLAGLAPGELEAVGSYEEANRGRRTILAKVAQLQAERA